MCYAYKPARLSKLRIFPHVATDIERLVQELKRAGKLDETADGFHYAKDTVPVIVAGGPAGTVRPMRWDLIPRGFLRLENLTLAEAIKKKNSRALSPATGKTWGFSSYNARIETVETLWAFKDAWQARSRGIIPLGAFRERPNMDGAPEESKGREYEIALDQTYFLAALFDTWKSKDGESIESCTVITGPSDDIPVLQGIWHERTPILLPLEACAAWLDPATTPKTALALLRKAAVPTMTVREVPKVETLAKAKTSGKRADEDQVALDL